MSGFGVERAGFLGHGAPRRSWTRGRETSRQQPEQGCVRTGRSEVDADAGGLLDDAGGDLEQAQPDGRELGPGEILPPGHGIAQSEHQPVGRAVQDEPELVGERALAGGAVGGELDLVQLDQIFCLSAGAVDGFVEVAGLAAKRGDDVAGVEAPRGRLSRATTRRSQLHEPAA